MEKFLNIPVQDLVVTGTSTTPSIGVDIKTTGNLFANVNPGDILHQSTDNHYYEVLTKVDDNNLTLAKLEASAVIPVQSGKTFFIHSGTASTGVLVSGVDVGLVEQLSTSTTTVAYDAPTSGNDLITLTHTPIAAGSEVARDTVQSQIVRALQTKWNEPSYNAIGDALISADNIRVIGIQLT